MGMLEMVCIMTKLFMKVMVMFNVMPMLLKLGPMSRWVVAVEVFCKIFHKYPHIHCHTLKHHSLVNAMKLNDMG
jgi:hypothetical protein